MGSTQASMALALNFNEFLVISSDFEKRNSRKNEKLLKDAIEAFLGAIERDFDTKPSLNLEKKGYPPYLGFGYQVASRFLIAVLEEHIDIGELMLESRDYVDEFVKLMKSKYKEVEFAYQDKETINNEEYHTCVAKHNKHVLAYGYAKTQKNAKRNCAKNALNYLKNQE